MKQICTITLLLMFSFRNSVCGQSGSKTPSDPYFTETWDTVSTYGPHTITRNILQDKNGSFWFASWQGIVRYDGKVFTNFTLKEGLIHFHVFSCFEDKAGNLWFGTVRGGLYRYDGKTFTLFTTRDGLADNTVSCMLEDKAGNMWFGTWGGLSRYDGKTFTNFTTANGLGSNNVTSIIQDKTGKMWLGCPDGGGISCYDGKTFSGFKNKDGQPFKQVTSLLEDKAGRIWIGSTEGQGLCCFDGKSFTGFKSDFIGYMIGDRKGNIWLEASEQYQTGNYSQSRRQVLYRFDGKSFTKITEKKEPDDCQIFGIMEDNTGNIWFGTMKGPCRYDGTSFISFTK